MNKIKLIKKYCFMGNDFKTKYVLKMDRKGIKFELISNEEISISEYKKMLGCGRINLYNQNAPNKLTIFDNVNNYINYSYESCYINIVENYNEYKKLMKYIKSQDIKIILTVGDINNNKTSTTIYNYKYKITRIKTA